MLLADDPIAAESKTPDADGSERSILNHPQPEPSPKRRWRLTRWIVGGGVAIGLFFALFVPTMCRSSEAANRIKCSSNLRQIGLAAMMFASAHQGVMPASWRELAEGGDITADVFICPTADDLDRAVDTRAATWAASLDDPAAHHCSYHYAGQGLRSADLKEEDVIAFELETNHKGDGVNLLFGDGHVEWRSSRAAYERLLADYASGGRPLRWRD